jgi:hypothetical protein
LPCTRRNKPAQKSLACGGTSWLGGRSTLGGLKK